VKLTLTPRLFGGVVKIFGGWRAKSGASAEQKDRDNQQCR
jgi:hypothetical protein